MKSMDRFQLRNTNFCEINEDRFTKFRVDTAVMLRKSKRSQEFTAKRFKKMPSSDTEDEYWALPRLERLGKCIFNLSVQGEEHGALVSLRKLFNQGEILMFERAIDLGLLAKLRVLLQLSKGERIIGEVFWIISILSYYGLYEVTDTHDLLDIIGNINEEWEFCIDNGLWAISNLILNNPTHTDFLLKYSILDKIQRILFMYRDNQNIVRISSWFLCNLLYSTRNITTDNAIQVLSLCIELFKYRDVEVTSNALKILTYFSESKELIEGIMETRVIFNVLSLVSEAKFRYLSLMVIGNICKFDTEYVDHLLQHNLLDILNECITASCPKTKKETLYIISNLVTNSEEQIRIIVSHRIFYFCLVALDDENQACRKEASFIFRNLARMNVRSPMVPFLNQKICLIFKGALQKKDTVFLSNVLEFLGLLFSIDQERQSNFYIIFSDAGCLNYLDRLINHLIPEISNKAISIVESNYGFEENDENLILTNKYCF